MYSDLIEKIGNVLKQEGQYITFLVGAGISAESGIPTFRGAEGFWKIGSVNYQPQEIGTYEMFLKNPLEVWKWFLFRKTICRNAQPNPGHFALAKIERLLPGRFALITQNVDGLHQLAGSSPENMYAIHGDLDFVRCGAECSEEIYPFPEGIADKGRGDDISPEELALLKCKKCGDYLRPHVLWFDEFYNEPHYRSTSALYAAYKTGILFIVGTSGATNLPHQITMWVMQDGAPVVVIDTASNIFTEVAEEYDNGHVLMGKSGEILPQIADALEDYLKK